MSLLILVLIFVAIVLVAVVSRLVSDWRYQRKIDKALALVSSVSPEFDHVAAKRRLERQRQEQQKENDRWTDHMAA